MSRTMCQHGFDVSQRPNPCVDCLVADPELARAEIRRLREAFDDLMEYIDDAKREAQKMGRVTGQPLDHFLRELQDRFPESLE